ncbi:MAG: hypothetical protein KDD94_04955 [Calditrichaeota bacterium]|nr:hypothetical protein [Calditrichota bacterium]
MLILLLIQFSFQPGHYLANASLPVLDSSANQLNFAAAHTENMISLSYHRPYGIPEFDLVSIECHNTDLQIGLTFSHFGFDLYEESAFSIWRSLSLSSVAIGMKYNLKLLNSTENLKRSAHSASVQISQQLSSFFRLQVTSEHILAASSEFESSYDLSLALEKQMALVQLNIRYLADYYFPALIVRRKMSILTVTASYLFKEDKIGAGLALTLDNYKINLAFSVHNALGNSHALGIAFFY